MKFLFKKLFLFFLLLSFYKVVFCNITLTNGSKHRLAVSYFEDIDLEEDLCRKVVRPNGACILPNNIPFTVSYKRYIFDFGNRTFKHGDGDYKILLTAKRYYKRNTETGEYEINEETGKRKLLKTKLFCCIFYKNKLCDSKFHYSINFS